MPIRRTSGPTTAEDLIREREERLRTDPEYRATVEAVERERAARVRLLSRAEQPIVADLGRNGLQVTSVWDLVNTADPYPDALPVLLEHLERGGYPEGVMESLGRALAVKPAVAWWERLKALYAKARDAGEEEGLAVALAACATKAQYEELVGFLSWEERGQSRIHFLRPIRRLGGARGIALLDQLRADPVFGREATERLRTVKRR